MGKRKNITKKIRFEVFKRDSFTCQYCGGSAPDIVLEVDHIDPVSKGGTNDITNLITSCKPCNSGKSNRELSDNSVAKKKKRQLDDIQERRNQLEMIAEWQKSMLDLNEQKVDIANGIFKSRTEWGIGIDGRKVILKIINQFGVTAVCEAVNIAIDQYYTGTESSWEKAFKKIGGICNYRSSGQDESLKQAYYIKGILSNRGFTCKFPVVRMTKNAIDKHGYEAIHRRAVKCLDEEEYYDEMIYLDAHA